MGNVRTFRDAVVKAFHLKQETPKDPKQEAFTRVWDSITDILSQDQIDRIERLHKNELDILLNKGEK